MTGRSFYFCQFIYKHHFLHRLMTLVRHSVNSHIGYMDIFFYHLICQKNVYRLQGGLSRLFLHYLYLIKCPLEVIKPRNARAPKSDDSVKVAAR